MNEQSIRAQIAKLESELATAKAAMAAKYALGEDKVLHISIPGIDATHPPADLKPSEFGNFTLWQSGSTRFTRGVTVLETPAYKLKFEGRVYLVPSFSTATAAK